MTGNVLSTEELWHGELPATCSALSITWPLSIVPPVLSDAPNTLLHLTFSLLVSTVEPSWDAGSTDWMPPDVTVLSFSSPLLRAVLRLVRGCFLSGLASTGAAVRGFTGWGLQRQTGGELQGQKQHKGDITVSMSQDTAFCPPQPTSLNPARIAGLQTLVPVPNICQSFP